MMMKQKTEKVTAIRTKQLVIGVSHIKFLHINI